MVDHIAQQAKPGSEPVKRIHQEPKVAVVGVGGYAGGELARLLMHHPRFSQAEPLFFGRTADGSKSHSVPLEEIHPQLALGNNRRSPSVIPFDWNAVAEAGVEVVFLALPHQVSREIVPHWIERGIRVIDLSGAWRLSNPVNRAAYDLRDPDPDGAELLQQEAVYGCPELYRDRISSARLVANPGCYATSIILALTPFLRKDLINLERGIICDAKSGVSGAGKEPTFKTHFMYAADNLSAYSVFGHRHTGELLEQLNLTSDTIQFTPHLLPIPRGIFSTIYFQLRRLVSEGEIESSLRNFYASSPLVRIHPNHQLPQIQHVVRSNYCDLGFELSPDGKRVVLVSCLDNLLKGASGQAIQNMNLMYGWGEGEGLL